LLEKSEIWGRPTSADEEEIEAKEKKAGLEAM